MSEDTPAVDTVLRLGFKVDPAMTLAELRHGAADPTIRFDRAVVWRAVRMPDGPATVRIAPAAGGWRVSAWGRAAETAVAAVPRWLGSEDDPSAFEPSERQLRELTARMSGMRFGRTDSVWPSLLPAICGQKVTSMEAQRAYHGIVFRYGERAPGPGKRWLAPEPAVMAALPYHELHSVGLEQVRATTLIRAAGRIEWLDAAIDMEPVAARTRLAGLSGLGPWTAAEVARTAFGDPDAVSVGDYHIPNLVSWALAGEPRGDDARMLELLEPYAGQRARVVRLLERSGVRPPKYGPRYKGRDIRGF